MIRLAEDIQYEESRKVPLDSRFTSVFIEVASNCEIDVAVVDSQQLREFEESETGDQADINWIEATRNYQWEHQLSRNGKRQYLLFWNSNEDKPANIAYKITPLE